ncbi:hypothetical protein FQR65_LT09752 [Abscondita terminalis]|nr:hypothetical protein FQR65_LT09752 [Abscondita terminalis]
MAATISREKLGILQFFANNSDRRRGFTNLTQETLENLKCCLCDEYLSVQPFYFYPHVEKIACGRCPVLFDENPMPYKILETLGSNLYFPCRYQTHGCSKITALNEMESHELFCSSKQYFCPAIPLGICSWQGFFEELIHHYEEIHKDDFLEEPKFEFDLSRSFEKNFLLSHQDDLFIIYVNCDLTGDVISWAVNYIGDKNIKNQSFYQIQLKNEKRNETVTLTRELIKHIDCSFQNSTETKVTHVRTILGDSFSVLCLISSNDSKIEEDEPKSTNMHNNILFDLECPVCNWYMCEPIYQCISGHSVCNNCKSNVQHCPTCRANMSDIRNFTLEAVSSHVKLYCENKKSGCLDILSVSDYKNHVDECASRGVECPFQENLHCNWIGSYSSCMKHLLDKHKDWVLENSNLISFLLDDVNPIKTYAVNFSDTIFRLIFKFENNYFYWSLQKWKYNESCSDDFMYEIDVLDSCALNQKFYLKRKCSNYVEHNQIFNEHLNYVQVPYDLISSFVNNRRLMYTFQILPQLKVYNIY